MSRIKAYKCLQADGNRALAGQVQRFIDEGWEPHGSVMAWPQYEAVSGGDTIYSIVMFQPMVKREAEHEEIKRLRDFERHCSQIVHELDNPCTGETGMLTFAHEELEKGLRGGPHERKP